MVSFVPYHHCIDANGRSPAMQELVEESHGRGQGAQLRDRAL